MHKLPIRDFSVQTHTEFSRAIPEAHADLPSLADKMLEKFGYVLQPDDIEHTSKGRFYDYRLFFKMFNGSADCVITSRSITTNFREGKTKKALNIVGQSIAVIYEIAATRPIQFNQLIFGAHAEFQSPEEYQAYMAPFIDTQRGYTSGGRIIQTKVSGLKSDVRVSFEKSVNSDHGIYLNVQFVTEEPLILETLEKMGKGFDEVAKNEQIDFLLADG